MTKRIGTSYKPYQWVAPMTDSPVMEQLKAGQRGVGDWNGFSAVYAKISRACDAMGLCDDIRGNDFHVSSMADLGSGHEERMKYRLGLLHIYGWIN